MEACEYLSANATGMQFEVHEQKKSYSLICRGERRNTIDEYLLLPVEDSGFVVVRQTIEF